VLSIPQLTPRVNGLGTAVGLELFENLPTEFVRQARTEPELADDLLPQETLIKKPKDVIMAFAESNG
jgi:hypothetical protein